MSSLLPNGKQRFVNDSGAALAGGSVYYYEVGTTIYKDTWQDPAKTVPNTNPIVLDARGECIVWGEGVYRQMVKDSSGNLIWDEPVDDTGDVENIYYTPDANSAFSISLKRALDETVDLRTKFGLTGDQNTDQTSALNDMFEYVNSLDIWGGTVLVDGCYTVTSQPTPLKNGLRIRGRGQSRSRILFTGCDGLIFDLSARKSQNVLPEVRDIALLTDGTQPDGYTGIVVTPFADYSTVTRTFNASRLLLCSESRWSQTQLSTADLTEWAIGIHIGNLTAGTNMGDCSIDNSYIIGSSANVNYDQQTGSIGILAQNVSCLRLNRPFMEMLHVGTNLQGQSEGMILYGGTHVDVGYGTIIDSNVLPGQNHCITDTHYKSHFRGIQVKDDGVANNTARGDSHFTNIHILERYNSSGDEKNKYDPDGIGFIGIEALVTDSTFTNCRVWSGNNIDNQSVNNTLKIGMRIGAWNNIVEGCITRGMHYAMDLPAYPVSTSFNDGSGMTVIDNFRHIGTSRAFFYSTAGGFPLGEYSGYYSAGSSQVNNYGPNWLLQYAEQKRTYLQSTGAEWLRETPESRVMASNGESYTMAFRTAAGSANNTDARFVVEAATVGIDDGATTILLAGAFDFRPLGNSANATLLDESGITCQKFSAAYADDAAAGAAGINIYGLYRRSSDNAIVCRLT